MNVISLYLIHAVKNLVRQLRRILFAESLSLQLVIFGCGTYFFQYFDRSDGFWLVILAWILPFLNRLQLWKFQLFCELKPVFPFQKALLFTVIPFFSLNGILFLAGLVYFLSVRFEMTASFLFSLVAIGQAFLLGLLFQRKVFFFNKIFMRELILAALSLAFFITFSASQDKLTLLFPQLILLWAVFIFSFKTTLDNHGLGKVPTLVRLRKTFLKIDGYQSLSILKQVNSFEMFVLVLSSGFAWYYFVFTDQVVQDGAFILGIFQIGILGMLSNNLLGLERHGIDRLWLFPMLGRNILVMKIKGIAFWFCVVNLPLFIGQTFHFGWATGLTTLLSHINLGTLLLALGVYSSVNAPIQRKPFASTAGAMGGIRILLMDYATLVIVGMTGLTAFRREPAIWLMTSVVCLPVCLLLLRWSVQAAGNKWDHRA